MDHRTHYVSGATDRASRFGGILLRAPPSDNDPEWLQTSGLSTPRPASPSRRSWLDAPSFSLGPVSANPTSRSCCSAASTRTRRRSPNAATGRSPSGTVLFDPDGEYFWPDDKGRPGLCDVGHMTDTARGVHRPRRAERVLPDPSSAGGVKLDLRRLPGSGDVDRHFLGSGPPTTTERHQDAQHEPARLAPPSRSHPANARQQRRPGRSSDRLLKLTDSQEMEALAARANATRIVNALHDPSSLLLDTLSWPASKPASCASSMCR